MEGGGGDERACSSEYGTCVYMCMYSTSMAIISVQYIAMCTGHNNTLHGYTAVSHMGHCVTPYYIMHISSINQNQCIIIILSLAIQLVYPLSKSSTV